jgi:hypothetical protein
MKAKKEFYYIGELKTYVKLSSIESFKLEKPMKSFDDSHFKCCIVSGKSIYWCNPEHFINLETLLSI